MKSEEIRKVADSISNKTVPASYYHFGKYRNNEYLLERYLKKMEQLEGQDLLGFDIKKEDEGKLFFAYKNDIERTKDDGTGVKHAWAVSPKYVR